MSRRWQSHGGLKMKSVQDILGLANGLTLAAAIYAVFNYLDKHASPAARAEISGWLRSVPSTGVPPLKESEAAWLGFFTWTFDQVFGREAFSLRRIRRSWAISTVVVICLTVLWGALRPEQFSALLDHADRDTTGLVKGVLFSAYVLNLIRNCSPLITVGRG
jgi:hypothetical protein